jgi:hypothetical protein
MIDVATTAAAIEDGCSEAANPVRAVGERAYLKSDLDHFGAGVPEIRRVARTFATTHPDLTHDELDDLVVTPCATRSSMRRSRSGAEGATKCFM